MSNKEILLAKFEEDFFDQNNNSFTVVGTPEFLEDSVIGKYMKVPSGSYLYIDNPEFAVGDSDFTLDAWIYYSSNYCSVSHMHLYNFSGPCIMPSFGAAFLGLGRHPYTTVPFNENAFGKWAHYAIVKKDENLYSFIDGKLQSIVATPYAVNSERLVINTLYGDSMGGYLAGENSYKNIRFCNFARWTEDFEPPNPQEPSGPSVIDLPVGLIAHFGMTNAPKGWLKCDGSEVSKTIYAKLFSTIGNTFGQAEDDNFFKLPDLRGEFIRGWDEGRGLDAGRIFGSTQEDALQDHSHGGVVTMSLANAIPAARVADETRPHNVALLPCIKY